MTKSSNHDDVTKWKHFPCSWHFVRGIHRWPVNSPHKGQWRGALMFSLICAWINGWVNNRDAGDLRLHRANYDVTIMIKCDTYWVAYHEIPHVVRSFLIGITYVLFNLIFFLNLIRGTFLNRWRLQHHCIYWSSWQYAGFRQWRGTKQALNHYLNQWWPIDASPGLGALIHNQWLPVETLFNMNEMGRIFQGICFIFIIYSISLITNQCRFG